MPNAKPYVERALFVVGEQNAGKSTQLRSMFRDCRFGTQGEVPSAKNLPDCFWLSNERAVYVRMTSPHEYDSSPKEFLDKAERKFADGRRWSFACPLQPYAAGAFGDAAKVIQAFDGRFNPERIRVVILDPQFGGQHREPSELRDLVDAQYAVGTHVEVLICDARSRTGNGLIYADFFDFT